MFDHHYFESRKPEEQVNTTVWIMSEKYMPFVEEEWLKHFSDDPTADPISVGTVSTAEIVNVNTDNLDIKYILNHQTRFHTIKHYIPRAVIKRWVGIYRNFDHKYDYVFVDDDWHETFWNGHISTFLLVDAIGMKKKMYSDSKKLLGELNYLSLKVDELAKKYPQLLFISAADNIIVKANFSPRAVQPIYNPELLLDVCQELREGIKDSLGCESYGIFTQGFNFYNDLSLYSKGSDFNHINTRSLGEPYKELFWLESKIRDDIKNSYIEPTTAYFSPDYFFSLNLNRLLLQIDYKKAHKENYIAKNLSSVIQAKRKKWAWEKDDD
jgi:hypothetical protein